MWLHPSDLLLLSAQMAGLLCEEEVLEVDNVKYCGYCKYHFSKMVSPACRWGWGALGLGALSAGRARKTPSLSPCLLGTL